MPPSTTSQRPSLRPLLKWTGGKRSEIPFLKASYPRSIRRVIEPFSGGAAVSFDLNPDRIVLNDLSRGLVEFYRTMGNDAARVALLSALERLDGVRRHVSQWTQGLDAIQVHDLFSSPEDAFAAHAAPLMASWLAELPDGLAMQASRDIRDQAISKTAHRIPALETKRGSVFSNDERRAHLETGMQAGIYTTMRRAYNGQVPHLSQAWQSAAWWFVRALCYSGMFRYGKGGHFNVPYGGIGYNSRDIGKTLRQLASPEVVDFFHRTEVFELDFQALFEHHDGFGVGDFIFVDPPYDSTFSRYNQEGDFGPEDQRRLAATLRATKAPWMLVIKNTPFILGLYQDPGLSRGVFGKQYQVNFRNRHDRAVEHLVVANYPLVYAKAGEIGIQPLD